MKKTKIIAILLVTVLFLFSGLTSNLVFAAAPGAPTGLTGTAGNAQVSLSWTAPSDNGGSAITDYKIEYKLSSEPTTWTLFADGVSATASATVTSLVNGSPYDFRVSAINADGTGAAVSLDNATGGTITTSGNYTIHTFTSGTGTFTSPSNRNVEVLVVAGGGGGANMGGGGGAGGLLYYGAESPAAGASYAVTTAPITVTVGAGGNGGTATWNYLTSGGYNGSNSIFGSLTAIGGGHGGAWMLGADVRATSGGSGGGGSPYYSSVVSTLVGGTGNSGQGNNGGDGVALNINSAAAGGGGGAGAVGASAASSTVAGNGGVGLQYSISGTPTYYAGGGGGGGKLGASGTAGVGGNGGGGDAGAIGGVNTGIAGTANTGGGGGGGSTTGALTTGGAGGSGIVIVRYINLFSLTPVAPTAPSAPIIGTATAGNAQSSVAFSAPVSNGGSAITNYTVTSSPGGFTATGESSPIVVTGLSNGTAYTFTVTADNAVGTSDPSAASNSVTPALPAVPAQVSGVEVTGVNKQVLIGWDAPDPGGSTITDYLVEYKASSAVSWSTFADGVGTNLKTIVTGLTNGTAYDFRVSASHEGGSGPTSTPVSATPRAITQMSFVFTGESNSGGLASNNDATASEKAPRSSVQITNLTSGNFLYEDLDIGTNNLRDHADLESVYNVYHGLELQLANSTEANAFPDNPQVFLTKTGQGGAKVSQWMPGGTYWTKFLERTNAAKTQLSGNNHWVVWMSIGINDCRVPTNTATWKSGMVTYINNIKTQLPNAIFILTQFQSMVGLDITCDHVPYNAVIAELAAEEPNVFLVDSTGATLLALNNAHWDYAGFKTLGARMVTVTQEKLGLIYPGMPTGFGVTATGTQAALSWTAPIANGGAAITDYLVEYKASSAGSWSTFSDGVSTATSTTISGLSADETYDFRVSAVSSNGTGNPVVASASDTVAPTLSFTNNVAAGAVNSDTISANWGDAYIKKWDYDADGNCSNTAGDYTKTSADSMNQANETNNGKYICLYGEDLVGNKRVLASENDINLDIVASATVAYPAGGSFTSAQSVTLTCADEAGSGCDKIYYTLDGTEPTTLSTQYSSAIAISSSATLKFFATDLAGNSEAVKTESYVIAIVSEGEDLEISNVEYSADRDSITVRWETNNDADSRVKYGTSESNLGQEEKDSDNEKEHKIVLDGLEADTQYYFKIYSEDEDESEDDTKIYSIKTDKPLLVVLENYISDLAPEREYRPFDSFKADIGNENPNTDESNNVIEKLEEKKEEIKETLKNSLKESFIAKVFEKDEEKIISEVKFKILDKNGNPIPFLPVTIYSDPQETITDAQGFAIFKNIPSGRHTLTFAYADENFSKKVSIAEPQSDSDTIQAEIIDIRAEKDALPWWVWGAIGGPIFLLLVSWIYFKRKLIKD